MNYLNKYSILMITFFYFFRPQILNPILSTALIPATIGCVFFILDRRVRLIVWNRTGLLFWISFIFILIWSLIIDIGISGIENAGPRSFTLSNMRFLFVTIGGAICISLVFSSGNIDKLIFIIKRVVFLQVFIGIIMLVFPDFKRFVYIYISGYNGSEKIFYDWFFYTRIFGWSEELFYLAPVFMTLVLSLFFYNPSRLINTVVFLLSISISLMNARLAILGVAWGIIARSGFIRASLFFILLSPIAVGIVTIYFKDNPIYDLIFSEFEGGQSRTLNILLEHHLIWLGKDVFDFIFGPMTYVHAGDRPVTVDIGWLIIGNFGGIVYVFLWLVLIFSLCNKAFSNLSMKLLSVAILSLLAFKGLLFTSNSVMNLLVTFALVGGVGTKIKKRVA